MNIKKYSPPAELRIKVINSITSDGYADYASMLYTLPKKPTGNNRQIIKTLLYAAALFIIAATVSVSSLILQQIFHGDAVIPHTEDKITGATSDSSHMSDGDSSPLGNNSATSRPQTESDYTGVTTGQYAEYLTAALLNTTDDRAMFWFESDPDNVLTPERAKEITSEFFANICRSIPQYLPTLKNGASDAEVQEYVQTIAELVDFSFSIPDAKTAVINGNAVPYNEVTRLIRYLQKSDVENITYVGNSQKYTDILFLSGGDLSNVIIYFSDSAFIFNGCKYQLKSNYLQPLIDYKISYYGEFVRISYNGTEKELSADDAKSLAEILSSCRWVTDTGDCDSEVIIKIDKLRLYYHLSCGNINMNSGHLDGVDTEALNSILKKYFEI